MTLEEAIHEQQLHLDGDKHLVDIRLRKAMQLSTEALKREQLLRHEIPYDRDGLLPGETEESPTMPHVPSKEKAGP